MKNLKAVLGLAVCLLLAGCLETRNTVKEQEDNQVIRKQVQTLQQTHADTSARFQDVDDELRKQNGRMDVIDNKVQTSSAKIDKEIAASDAKAKENDAAYREEFTKLHSQVDDLKTQIAALVDQQKRANDAAAAQASAKEKNPFASAEEKFTEKHWQDAILDYDRYRKANPKGKQFATATLKTGECFQELGLKDEAKAFYDEVVDKFPKTKEATVAKLKLKALKKK